MTWHHTTKQDEGDLWTLTSPNVALDGHQVAGETVIFQLLNYVMPNGLREWEIWQREPVMGYQDIDAETGEWMATHLDDVAMELIL